MHAGIAYLHVLRYCRSVAGISSQHRLRVVVSVGEVVDAWQYFLRPLVGHPHLYIGMQPWNGLFTGFLCVRA